MGVSPRVALCRTVSTASCPSHKQQQLLVLLARPLCGWPTLWTEHRPCAVTRHPLMEQAFLNTSLLLQAHWGPCHDVITKVHMVYTIKISVFALARSCKHFGWPSAGSVLSDAELQLKGKILLKLKLLEWAPLSNHTSMCSRAWSPLCTAIGMRISSARPVESCLTCWFQVRSWEDLRSKLSNYIRALSWSCNLFCDLHAVKPWTAKA